MSSKPNLGHACGQQLVLSFSPLSFLSLKFIKVFFLSFSHLRHLFNQCYAVFKTRSFQLVHNYGCGQLKVEIGLPLSFVSHSSTYHRHQIELTSVKALKPRKQKRKS